MVNRIFPRLNLAQNTPRQPWGIEALRRRDVCIPYNIFLNQVAVWEFLALETCSGVPVAII